MEKLKNTTLESALFAAALVLAAVLRFAWLGGPALSDYEATWALQALGTAQGERVLLDPQPGYVLLTGLMFFVFSSTDFLARFLPALAGSLIVLLPIFFRSSLGRSAALLMAFGLALDPGLVTISRLAGGPMPAASFGLLALGALYLRRWPLAGVLAGLALLSGPFLFHGALIFGLTALAGILLVRAGLLLPFWTFTEEHAETTRGARTGLIWLAGTVVLLGTLFGMAPQGLGAMVSALPAYLAGWVRSSEMPALRLAAMLPLYQPLVVLLGIFAIFRAWRDDREEYILARWLSLWAVLAFITVLLYPSRQAGDLVWVLVPLWGLAAVELSRVLTPSVIPMNRIISASQAVFLFALMAFAWINLASLANIRGMPAPDQLRSAMLLIAGAMVMAILTTLLVALGWSWAASKQGLLWGVVLVLSIYMISTLWGSAYLRPNRSAEFWTPQPGIVQAGLLRDTLDDLSSWQTGHFRQLDVAVLYDAPSLYWLLRDWTGLQRSAGAGGVEMPSVIISGEEQAGPALSAAYRGQTFIWNEHPSWTGVLPGSWQRWIVSREAPSLDRKIIVWVRSDLFPGGEVLPVLDMPREPFEPGVPEGDLER
jgi:hypothetical protein